MHLLFFSEKPSGSAAVRSVGDCGSPASEDAQPNRSCYKGQLGLSYLKRPKMSIKKMHSFTLNLLK